MLRAIDGGSASALLLLDMSAAFDTVDHDILLKRLASLCGLSGLAIQWFASYLNGRSQAVTTRGAASCRKNLSTGVPQGSVLGPPLYLIYVNPLQSVNSSNALRLRQFSDDTQAFVEFAVKEENDRKSALQLLSSCAEDIESWLTINKVQLNIDKSIFLYVMASQHARQLNCAPLVVRGCEIPPSSSARNLGVTIDSCLTMVPHVQATSRSAFYQLRRIAKIREMLTEDTAKTLVHSLVMSRLDYANSLLSGLPESLLDRLQKVQNAAARVIVRAGKFEAVSGHIRYLHWLPVRQRITFKVAVLTFRCLNGSAPPYLTRLVSRYARGEAFDLRRLARSQYRHFV